MLQHDYLLEVIGQFVGAVSEALLRALRDGDPSGIEDAEGAVAELLDLDVQTAMSLSPESLVTMMELSGVGESVASYASYALGRVADAYEAAGDGVTAGVRRAQAAAVARAFHADGSVPEEFGELERELSQGAR